jgi:predicted kinase
MISALPKTFIILSGLPGTGKTTMAQLLVNELQIPILSIDDVVDAIPEHMAQHTHLFWEDMVHILLHLAESQLAWGNSIIVDSVFMGVDENQTQHRWSDRHRAYEIAGRAQANFRPIYFYISDEDIWQERLARRAAELQDPRVATWSQVSMQRQYFQPWQPGQALFIDSLNSVTDNFTEIMKFIKASDINLSGWN